MVMILWPLLLDGDASKTGINILVMRLEPVAKAGAQHASRRAGRTTFDDVMLAIKEIGRIAGVEGKRCKTLERGEFCRSPFPTVAELADYAESAAILWKGVNVDRIPPLKIEIALLRRDFVAPWKFALAVVSGTVRGTLPLHFAWQSFFLPVGIGLRFGVTDVNGSGDRKQMVFEHAAIEPTAIDVFPKCRVGDVLLGLPLPVFG